MNQVVLYALPVICGIAMVMQARFMGTMDDAMGTWESVFITYGGGGLLIGLLMLVQRGGNLGEWQTVPWYSLTAGVMGLIIVGTISYSIPRLGFIATFAVAAVAQYVLSALLDHYGWMNSTIRPLDLGRLMGVGLLFVGAWLIIRP